MDNLFVTDFSESLHQKKDIILQQWLELVIKDEQISTTEKLSIKEIKDRTIDIINALVSILSQSQSSQIDLLIEASFHHGGYRAEQNYDVDEIVREYHLLRTVIIDNLKIEMLKTSTEDVFITISIINKFIDAAISHSLKSYLEIKFKELSQVQNQLNLTVEELKRLVVSSQENLFFMAHEMKNPLTSIIGYSDLFIRQHNQQKLREELPSIEYIESILRGGRQLLTIINDALQFAQYQTHHIPLKYALINVRPFIKTTVEQLKPLIDGRDIEIIINDAQAPDQVITDGLRLQQILTNLLSNAIRYTETGQITIESSVLSQTEWSILIRDSGIGISPEDQLRIFQPFERIPTPDGRYHKDSTGLGLAIVDKLISALQGRIYIASQQNLGTEIMVILPYIHD